VAIGKVLQGVPFHFSDVMHILLCALAGIARWLSVDGYRVTSALPSTGPSNPMLKIAELQPGAWFANYAVHAWFWVAPAAGFAGALLALLGSAFGIAGIIMSVGASMFPIILPSSVDPRASLTVWHSSSSHLTLFIVLVVTGRLHPDHRLLHALGPPRAVGQGRCRGDPRGPRPRMEIPFTALPFFGVFADYNTTLCPAHVLLTGMAGAAMAAFLLPKDLGLLVAGAVGIALWAPASRRQQHVHGRPVR